MMDVKATVIDVLNNRFACKLYQDKELTAEQLNFILEAGRLSPTSFGLEGWFFHVVKNKQLRPELTEACFDQQSVATAPVNIIITALRDEDYQPYGDFVAQRALRFGDPLQVFIDDYIGYYDFLVENNRVECWSRSQCYIAAANMMSAAAFLEIQSCAIEGFDEQMVAKVIDLDLMRWQVALVIPFGFPAEPIRAKIRQPLEDLVKYH